MMAPLKSYDKGEILPRHKRVCCSPELGMETLDGSLKEMSLMNSERKESGREASPGRRRACADWKQKDSDSYAKEIKAAQCTQSTQLGDESRS